ncbi:formylglycine-generating enzyme family protein [Oceaniferula spumae]
MKSRKSPSPSCFLLCIATPSLLLAQETKTELPAAAKLDVTKKVHQLIVKSAATPSPLKAYTETVPKAGNATLQMLPVKAGEFQLGSPDAEPGRNADEGPQKKIKVDAFWMSKTEITWKLYNPYYKNGKPRNKDGTLMSPSDKDELSDVISQPTPQYHDMFLNNSFVNDPDHPAMDMTQHAASKFCQWLSAQTGHFYRLPTEAEWEYACRAGTSTAWSFGDDESKLGDHAWFADNSNFTYQKVGLKKPNPWGFHDMHGNVAEWVLDQFSDKFYGKLKDGEMNPWNAPTTRYPRTVRGGSWDSEAPATRSAARLGSAPDWKQEDPQIPKSVWYHTDGQHVGFRIVRPVKIPSAEEMHRYWNTDWWSPERNKEDL